MASSEPEEVSVYVTHRKWESKLNFNEPYVDIESERNPNPWQLRILNEENPHHWALRSFKAYKSAAPHLTRVDFNMLTFYTAKEKTDNHVIYWVCSRQVDGRRAWWVVTPNQEEKEKLGPSPRHKEFYSYTIEEEFYAIPLCRNCLWKGLKTQIECETCNGKKKEEQKDATPSKPVGPPAIGSEPTLGPDEVSVCVTNRRWESRLSLDKPYLKDSWALGFEDGNMHHWAFKAFKAWKSPAPGRIKVTVDKYEFYAYQDESSEENPHNGVLYYACQKPEGKAWWIFCPMEIDKLQYEKEKNLYGWKPTFQFYAKPDRESESFWNEKKEDRRRWSCEDCNHINPGYRMECEFCYESRVKESKQGIEVRRFGDRAKSPTPASGETKPTYVLSPPKKYLLPFQPGTPSKASLLDLLKEKDKIEPK